MGLLPYRLALLLSTRSLVLQREVPKSGPWKGFFGAPAAAKAAVGYLERLLPRPHPKPFRDPSSISPLNGATTMGHFLLHRPVARRPAQQSRSAARGVSTGVTSRRTGGRARQVGQAFAAHEPRPSDPGLVLASWVKDLSHGCSKDTPALPSESTLECDE